MKTKTTWTALTILLGLLVWVETASAFYNPSTGRWLNRDPIEEAGGLNLFGFVRNNPVTKVDPLGLYNWGTIGEFDVTKDADGTSRRTPKGNWLKKRPGDGEPCCVEPTQHSWNRTDMHVSMWHIPMRVSLKFSNENYRELVLVWFTCILSDKTANARLQCNNSTSCDIPTTPVGFYETWVQIAYLSCEKGRWTTKTDMKYRDYTGHLIFWTWKGN